MLIVIRKKLLSFIIIFNTLLFLKHTFLDVAWCLCVCLSVCLSVCHNYEHCKTAAWIKMPFGPPPPTQ